MSTNPLSGARYLLEGMRLITQPGLRAFVVVPLLINILVFSAAIYAGVGLFEGFIATLESRLPSWLGWIDWLLWPLFVLVLVLVVFNSFALVANLIASPFNGLLADKVERMLTGHAITEGTSLGGVLAELVPTLLEELRKLVYALALAVPFLFLLLVPVIGQVLWFFYLSWILAVQYADYPMGNHGLRFREMRQRLARARATSLGFGGAATLLSMIPVVNFILMPSAVAGATLMWVRELKGTTHDQGATHSRVVTHGVSLRIDHLSGRISGEILAGPLAGRALDEVDTADLVELLEACYASDPDSAEALEVYLERERDRSAAASQRQPRHESRPTRQARMDPDEARAILGLSADATMHEIRAAHRRLIQRLHPDRGGSDYLAAKINEAKQILLD